MSDKVKPHEDRVAPPGTGIVIAALLGLPGIVAAALLWRAGAPVGCILLAHLGTPAATLGLLCLALNLGPRPLGRPVKWISANV